MTKKSDIIIIGGGASGLIAGIAAASFGKKTLILEQKDRVGKKILATGNGKCNYTNVVQEDGCYRGENPSFAKEVLSHYGVQNTLDFFQGLGIYPKLRNGCYYPFSEQASSVLDVLRMELEHLGVVTQCETRVQSIHPKENLFEIKTNKGSYFAKRVILSTGGLAYPSLGSDGSGYPIMKQLGHHLIPAVPALTGLVAKEEFFPVLSGVRVEAAIQIYVENAMVASEYGELQLTAYGLSGIPVFQISRFASRALYQKKSVVCRIDFLTCFSKEELIQLFQERAKRCTYKTVEEQLNGLLNKKLAQVILKRASLPLSFSSAKVTEAQWMKLVEGIKNFEVHITKPCTFEKAQVTAGGVTTMEIHSATMESKLLKGLYVTGELLDIDGTCGGYNLQWAWSTGYLAGKHAALSL